MKKTINSTITKETILSALLSLSVAIEFIYDMGERFGNWYRNGGDQQIRNAFVTTVAASIWLVSTARLGYAVLCRNAPLWASRLNTARHQLSRAFSYEYQAS